MATFNGAATLPGVLAAYQRLRPPTGPWQMVVIDNGSTDATAVIVASHATQLPLRLLREPLRGKNRALNTALALLLPAAGADDLLIFTDDDATPAPDWLQQWEAVAGSQPDYAVFGGAIAPDWAAPPPAWLLRVVPTGLTYGLTAPDLAPGPVFPGLVWGANMAVRGAVFVAGHRFAAAVGPAGGDYAMGSETEFARRVALAGFRSWHSPAPRVAHHIRAHQLRLAYVLQKARRFGRGQFRQDRPGIFPELARVPRWIWRRTLAALGGCALAWLRRDRDSLLRARWDLAYLNGYLSEAWRGAAPSASAGVSANAATSAAASANAGTSAAANAATSAAAGATAAGPTAGPAARTVLVTSYSGELGGMELRMAQEVRYLQGAGLAATLALRPFPGLTAWAQRLAAEQINVAVFDPPAFLETWRGRRWQLWRARWLAPVRMKAFRADLVHVAFCWTNYGASVLWLAARCHLPTVISIHNAFPATAFGPWQQPLLRAAFASVRGVYAVSASAMEHFLAIYQPYLAPEARLAVIPNPVDTSRFRPCMQTRRAARLRWGLPQDALVLGSVARLSPQKQPESVLALFGMLRKSWPELWLVMAGQGPLEASLRAQAMRLGLDDHVVFTGFVDDVAALMPAFDLHLLLSRSEGFGISTVEAMACGVPVVATDVPGNADVLRDSAAGLLVAAGELQPAVAAIAALLADPQRRARMGQQGRAEAQARYGVAVVGELVRDFYAGLV